MSDAQREEYFKNKFPEQWICLICDPPETIERDNILNHLMWNHDYDNLTWEAAYNRLSAVGAV